MRAAYAALILGIVGGLWLASRVLSADVAPASTTVAGTLALDVDGIDLDGRRSEAVAVLVARCMNARGLAWRPWIETAPSVPDAELEPVAWAERWGFGVSTTLGRRISPPADRNLTAVDAMPADMQARYRDALYGTAPGDPGCQRSANDTVYGLRERFLAPLRHALTDLDAGIAADPRAIQAVDAWRLCVAPIAGPDRPERRTFAQQLIARFQARVDAIGTTPAGMAEQLALQTDERRVAATLARCEARFAESRASVAAPFEAAFVTRHREELTRIGTAIRDAEAALPTMPP